MIESASRVHRKPDPLFTRLDDDLLGLDTHTGLAYGLNSSAARVWELMEGWTTPRALCEHLELEYTVEREVCSRQVMALLERLHAAGLIDVEPPVVG